jgi:hypothetical protein
MLNRPTPACRGAIDIAAAAPQSHNGGRSLVEYLVQSQRHDARVLLSAGEHSDGLGQLGVDGQRPVRISVGADDVGQQYRVGGIGLAPIPHAVSDTARPPTG